MTLIRANTLRRMYRGKIVSLKSGKDMALLTEISHGENRINVKSLQGGSY